MSPGGGDAGLLLQTLVKPDEGVALGEACGSVALFAESAAVAPAVGLRISCSPAAGLRLRWG